MSKRITTQFFSSPATLAPPGFNAGTFFSEFAFRGALKHPHAAARLPHPMPNQLFSTNEEKAHTQKSKLKKQTA